MGDKTKIAWADATWNPITGCMQVSEGCWNCYAKRQAIYLQEMGMEKYRNGFQLTLHLSILEVPAAWTRPRRIFVNSMSDTFHEDVPLSFLRKMFGVIRATPRHTYLILTKRTRRLRAIQLRDGLGPWPANAWAGVTVEREK